MSDEKRVRISDLLHDIDAAAERMGVNNPHRRVLAQCRGAICELADRSNYLADILADIARHAEPIPTADKATA